MNAVESLMTGLIDYAGLFPPAGLSVDKAVRNYGTYRNSDHGWAMGRLVVPFKQYDDVSVAVTPPSKQLNLPRRATQAEFEAAFHSVPPRELWREDASTWRLTCIGSSDPCEDRDLFLISRAVGNLAFSTWSFFPPDSVEWKVETPQLIAKAMRGMPSDITAYFEVPLAEDPAPWLTAIAAHGARAKIRTGGVAAEAFPSTAEVARFLSLCARAKVGFKATAGLHHALRSVHPFTYEPNSMRGKMHGFLNVFLAAALAWLSDGQADLAPTLEAESASQFRMEPNTLHWLDYSVNSDQLAIVRQNFAFSFGSCSFEVPLNDLKVLGWL
jgi:hypothetical protein